jgi:hypothetical protein
MAEKPPPKRFSIVSNEYTKLHRWTRIKGRSEEITRLALEAQRKNISTEEAARVEQLALTLLDEIRALIEEQRRDTELLSDPPLELQAISHTIPLQFTTRTTSSAAIPPQAPLPPQLYQHMQPPQQPVYSTHPLHEAVFHLQQLQQFHHLQQQQYQQMSSSVIPTLPQQPQPSQQPTHHTQQPPPHTHMPPPE